MKKLLLVAALGVAGLMSANGSMADCAVNLSNNSENHGLSVSSAIESRGGGILTWQVSYVDCSGNVIYDTLTWEEGNMSSYYAMIECDLVASEYWSNYNC